VSDYFEKREAFGQFTRNATVEFHDGRTFFPNLPQILIEGRYERLNDFV